MILKLETYNFHRLDLTRQAGFIVTVYDEDGLRLAATMPFSTQLLARPSSKAERSSTIRLRDRENNSPDLPRTIVFRCRHSDRVSVANGADMSVRMRGQIGMKARQRVRSLREVGR